jgi:hypothetical protein
MEKLKGSTALIVLGIALLAFGAIYPFVTLVVDNTAPIITETNPANGQTYMSVNVVTANVVDQESGVKSVYARIFTPDGTSWFSGYMTLVSGNIGSGQWKLSLQGSITTPSGIWGIKFNATNYAGMSTILDVAFQIYTQLQGKWYINNIEITDNAQTVYSTNATVTFKFQKTAGIEDSKISCWVEEGTTKILTLTLTDTTNHIWTGSYTFSAGTHNLAIKAYDGTATITYSIVGLTIPGAFIWVMTTQQALLLAGALSIVAGVVMRIKKK